MTELSQSSAGRDLMPAARQRAILSCLTRDGEVRVVELARKFGVNAITVRRDLDRLAARGLLGRVHGGAVGRAEGKVQFTFSQHQQTQLVAKSAIATAAAELISPGKAVSLDTGTTTLAVARCLAAKPGLRVLTSSLAAASLLHPRENIELILLGGIARKDSPDLFGTLTEENLRRFRVDWAVIGADAAASEGLFTTDIRISRVSQALIEGAARTMVVLDSSKFATRAFVQFVGWESVDVVITDERTPPEVRDWLEQAVGEVIYVPLDLPADRPEGDE